MLPREANLHPFPSNSVNLGYWRQLSLMSGNACWREFLAKVSWHIHLQEGCRGRGAKQFAALEACQNPVHEALRPPSVGYVVLTVHIRLNFRSRPSTWRREICARGDDRKAALACRQAFPFLPLVLNLFASRLPACLGDSPHGRVLHRHAKNRKKLFVCGLITHIC